MDAERGLATLPGWLRPRAALVLASWFGKLLMRCVSGLLEVQIFDRAMTLAAQAFTSIFPLLIMFGALLGAKYTRELAEFLDMPDSSRKLLSQAFDDQGFNSFGVISALIVIVSATGLARALVRSYAAVWGIGKIRSGAGAAARWVLVVLLLAAFMVLSRLPLGVAGPPALFVADAGLTVLLPAMLLGGAVPARKLVPGGLVFALIMLAVRPAGELYLPRALRSSDAHYGTIGLAFTYIGWLYVISFCLLASAVIGHVLAEDLSLVGKVIRGEAGLRSLSVLISPRQLAAVRHRRVEHDGAEPDRDDRPDRIDRGVREIDHQGDAAQHDGEHPAPDLAEHEPGADHHEHDAEPDVNPAEPGQADAEQHVRPAALERLGPDERERPDRQMRPAQEHQH